VEGFPENEITRLRAESPEEGLTGVSLASSSIRFRTPSRAATRRVLTSMEVLLA
jgi:hypothetical protein